MMRLTTKQESIIKKFSNHFELKEVKMNRLTLQTSTGQGASFDEVIAYKIGNNNWLIFGEVTNSNNYPGSSSNEYNNEDSVKDVQVDEIDKTAESNQEYDNSSNNITDSTLVNEEPTISANNKGLTEENEKDIEMLISSCECTRDQAIAALKESEFDPLKALIDLTK